MNKTEYINLLNSIKGKTIGIVYVYENDSASGAKRYDPWKGDVLSDWVRAVYELQGLPLVMDLRTFMEKTTFNTLPKIDYIINLSNGCYELSTLGLVPSMCSYWGIPCIPCNADTLLIGENKYISNILAKHIGLNVPESVKNESQNTITRPYSFGSSYGTYKGISTSNVPSFTQEFIPGFDVTVPIIYNPLENRLVTLPAIAYKPTNYDPQWYLGYKQKVSHNEYEKQSIKISKSIQEKLIDTAYAFGITTYCRFDNRYYCNSKDEMSRILNNEIILDELNFIEINPKEITENAMKLLSALDIEEFDMGISGAAVATLISQSVSFIILIT